MEKLSGYKWNIALPLLLRCTFSDLTLDLRWATGQSQWHSDQPHKYLVKYLDILTKVYHVPSLVSVYLPRYSEYWSSVWIVDILSILIFYLCLDILVKLLVVLPYIKQGESGVRFFIPLCGKAGDLMHLYKVDIVSKANGGF